jgi:hypothetical protein
MASLSFAQDEEKQVHILVKGVAEFAKFSIRTNEISDRLLGRVLGCLIQEGMAVDDVYLILGRGNEVLVGRSWGTYGWITYNRRGVDISISSYKTDTLRVTKIEFYPLFP